MNESFPISWRGCGCPSQALPSCVIIALSALEWPQASLTQRVHSQTCPTSLSGSSGSHAVQCPGQLTHTHTHKLTVQGPWTLEKVGCVSPPLQPCSKCYFVWVEQTAQANQRDKLVPKYNEIMSTTLLVWTLAASTVLGMVTWVRIQLTDRDTLSVNFTL